MRTVFNFAILFYIVFWGCTSTKTLKQDTIGLKTDQNPERIVSNKAYASNTTPGNLGSDDRLLGLSTMPETITPPTSHPNDSLNRIAEINGKRKMSSYHFTGKALGMPNYSEHESAVAHKIVENYLNSKNKEPGGHCLNVSKTRFEKAYEEVYGHSVYEDLPDSIATVYYTPKEVFNFLYVSASGIHEGWRSMPIEYRGKGNAGAIAYAGMGTLVDSMGIWSGELRPGAPMQVWKHRDDYVKVVIGIDKKEFDPFGHSFIFIDYVYDEHNTIIGIRIADQGYQSYRTLIAKDYEVWWAVNLSI